MPIEYTIDKRHNTVFLRAWGHVSSQEVREHHLQLRSDPDFHPNHNGIFDLIDVTSTDYYYTQMKKMMPEEPWGAQSRRAVVVRSPLVFGLTRTFILLAKNMHGSISIFRNLKKAQQFLHLELPDDKEKKHLRFHRCIPIWWAVLGSNQRPAD